MWLGGGLRSFMRRNLRHGEELTKTSSAVMLPNGRVKSVTSFISRFCEGKVVAAAMLFWGMGGRGHGKVRRRVLYNDRLPVVRWDREDISLLYNTITQTKRMLLVKHHLLYPSEWL